MIECNPLVTYMLLFSSTQKIFSWTFPYNILGVYFHTAAHSAMFSHYFINCSHSLLIIYPHITDSWWHVHVFCICVGHLTLSCSMWLWLLNIKSQLKNSVSTLKDFMQNWTWHSPLHEVNSSWHQKFWTEVFSLLKPQTIQRLLVHRVFNPPSSLTLPLL